MALSNKQRPDMSEIAAMADMQEELIDDDESASDNGSRNRLRTASALSGEFAGVAEDDEDGGDDAHPPGSDSL